MRLCYNKLEAALRGSEDIWDAWSEARIEEWIGSETRFEAKRCGVWLMRSVCAVGGLATVWSCVAMLWVGWWCDFEAFLWELLCRLSASGFDSLRGLVFVVKSGCVSLLCENVLGAEMVGYQCAFILNLSCRLILKILLRSIS